MSVKIHEAFCLDSARRRFHFSDHFLGDSHRDLWRSTGDAGGSTAVVDQQDGGIIRITTNGALNEDWRIDWGDIRSLRMDKQVTFEARVKLNSNALFYFNCGLYKDADERLYFFAQNGGNWNLLSQNGGALTNDSSGVAIDTDYHVFRIECFPTGEAHFYIDDVEAGNSPVTSNLPNDADDYMQPYIRLQTREAVVKTLDVDYVVIRQDR